MPDTDAIYGGQNPIDIKAYSLLAAAHHRVRPGDTLSGIAARYRVRLSDLKRWNPGIRLLHINQKIYIRSR